MPSRYGVISGSCCSRTSASAVIKTVSYTHLDVYKRQAFMTERLVEFIEELGEEDANAFVRILEKALAYSQKRKEKLEEGEQK